MRYKYFLLDVSKTGPWIRDNCGDITFEVKIHNYIYY